MRRRTARLMILAAALLITSAIPCAAQVSTGRIDATVRDDNGALIEGAAVQIGGTESHASVTDALGEAHFVNLSPGHYTVTVKRDHFSDYLNRNIAVSAGAGVALDVDLSAAGPAIQVQVTNRMPVVDPRTISTSTDVSVDEMQNVPSSRDPWVVLQTIPGVVVDRVNVGGAFAAQQSVFLGKGTGAGDNSWNIDGIAVTDMAALGSTPTYFDFDALQEIHVTTGGADVQSPTPGVQLNIVLKSGTNTARGSARFYFENDALESNNVSPDLTATIGGTTGEGDRTHAYKDYGLELGGPVFPNRLWAWASAGKTNADIITLTNTHDRPDLLNTAFKATGQATNDLRGNVTYFRGSKKELGRGAGPTRADEATYNQTGAASLFKGEADIVVWNTLFVAARAAHLSDGFTLAARGGTTTPEYIDDAGVARGSTDTMVTDRPQNSVSLDGNLFRGHQEFKLGLEWRKASFTSRDAFPGDLITIAAGYPQLLAEVTRPTAQSTDGSYTSAYGADSWTMKRMTLTAGLRWDRQTSSLDAASVAASSVLPSLLPARTETPLHNAIVWNAVAPRIGMTYALTDDRTTIVRASYAMFSSQLGAAAAGAISSLRFASILFTATDMNGNQIADPGEIHFGLGNVGASGFDPLNPTAGNPNQIGAYATPITQELTAGFDHELSANFGMSATFTYRYLNHFNWAPLIGVTSADYRQTGTLSGTVDPIGSFSVPLYAVDPATLPAGGGTVFEERQGYHQRYLGVEGSAVKRLSDRWMARFGFSTNDDREYFNGASALADPTPSPADPRINGGSVVTIAPGSGQSPIYVVLPRYQVVANGMYQGPWGFNVGGNWLLRQGYAAPYFRSNVDTADPLGPKNVLVTGDAARFRLPRVSSLDVRLERSFRLRALNITADLDVFNVTNSAAVLARQYDLRLTGPIGFNKTLEIMNPRIVRLGARVVF